VVVLERTQEIAILGSIKPEKNVVVVNFAAKTPPEIVAYHSPNKKIRCCNFINKCG